MYYAVSTVGRGKCDRIIAQLCGHKCKYWNEELFTANQATSQLKLYDTSVCVRETATCTQHVQAYSAREDAKGTRHDNDLGGFVSPSGWEGGDDYEYP